MENEIYGSNVVTGSIEDAAGQTVQITNNGKQEDVAVKDLKGGEDKKKEQSKDAATSETDTDTQADETKENDAVVEDLKKDIEKHEKTVSDVEAKLSEKGVDFAAIKAEYDANQELSDETYAALDKAGYSKDTVDMLLEGLQSVASKFANAVVDHAGGKRAFKGIQDFVKSEGQKSIDIFNKVMNSADYEQVAMFVDGIKARMALKHGTNTSLTLGQPTPTTAVQGFASKGEMVAAMSDPKYRTDSAYRAQVQQKVINSTIL